MTRWQIQLSGNKFDLEDLYNNSSSSTWSVVKDGEEYYLESPNFDDIDDRKEVSNEGSRLLSLINGFAKLTIPGFQTIDLRVVCELDENGNRSKRYIEITDTINIRAKFYAPTLLNKGKEEETSGKKLDLISSYIIIAKDNKFVFDAINIYSKKSIEWNDLYKILEIISDSGDINEVLKESQSTKEELIRFKQTCQSYEAIGDNARHHHSRHKKPDNPMSKQDAGRLIEKLLLEWIKILQKTSL